MNYFLNTFWIYFVGVIISGVISFITIPLIVKYYGVESYGDFSLVQNLVLVLISFGGGWLNQCVLRFNNYSTTFKFTIFQFYFLTFLPLSLVCFVILLLMKVGLLNSIIGTISMSLGSMVSLSIVFYQSKFNARKTFYFDFVRILIFALMVIFLNFAFYHLPSLLRLIVSFFISYLVSFFFLLRLDFHFFKRSINLVLKKINKDFLIAFFKRHKHLFEYGWPLALWFTISSLLNISDRYIIDYYLSNTDLGTYSAIYDLLYKGFSLFYAPILLAGFPIMTKKYNAGDKKGTIQFLKKLIVLEFLIFLVIILVAYFLRGFFIERIVGITVSKQSVELVMPIVIGAFIWQLAMLVHKPLEFEFKTKVMLVFCIVALVVNIVLNFMFIPKYGIVFASYSTVLSALVYLLLIIFFIGYRNKRVLCGT